MAFDPNFVETTQRKRLSVGSICDTTIPTSPQANARVRTEPFIKKIKAITMETLNSLDRGNKRKTKKNRITKKNNFRRNFRRIAIECTRVVAQKNFELRSVSRMVNRTSTVCWSCRNELNVNEAHESFLFSDRFVLRSLLLGWFCFARERMERSGSDVISIENAFRQSLWARNESSAQNICRMTCMRVASREYYSKLTGDCPINYIMPRLGVEQCVT